MGPRVGWTVSGADQVTSMEVVGVGVVVCGARLANLGGGCDATPPPLPQAC